MVPHYSKVHNRFKLNGHHFNREALKEVAYSLIKEGVPYEQVTGDFIADWLNDDDTITVKTSGSTGAPKSIQISKQAMVNSAIATGDFFMLQPGNTALNCLPTDYIAGKMMLVRAMLLGLEIDCVEPSSQPIFDYDKDYDFCAMVPLQLGNTLDYTSKIKNIIVGGSKIPSQLINRIKTASSQFYETYGMTETVTHVALKRLESKKQKGDSKFNALPNVEFSQDDRQCLVINAPNVSDKPIVTNDIVELDGNTNFEWLGRFDNVINSGGVKLFPEQIEAKLESIIGHRFIFASQPDDALGEKLILIVEAKSIDTKEIINKIKAVKTLSKYEIPKAIYSLDKFAETVNGKIQRQKTVNSALA
ncbi:MAG: O-succinylbenzoic acid--CoA ligase [Winogradskyella sp.]|uniref:AMP-binding protein n=1 Tax=Winogradskyella sp. TaxID=1883156 RepID=UPI000F419DB7|nr:AMP-binding protein [Winogradskyella sp.]RNC87103.1 MAG: O-succinylbenzoic acid--CoA ligase [Winogradskyella sp.]